MKFIYTIGSTVRIMVILFMLFLFMLSVMLKDVYNAIQ